MLKSKVMTSMRFLPVILAGGSGTRLWPRSRSAFPKQFLDIAGPQSMLSATAARFSGDAKFLQPIIVGAEEHRFLIAQDMQAAGLAFHTIIAEPVRRNTAPAIAAAALLAAEDFGPETVLCVMPADHVVRDPVALRLALAKAGAGAHDADLIVTIGIRPAEPATGYGYIEQGDRLEKAAGLFAVTRFVEKPGRATAEKLLANGQYFWNAGMFVARADVLISEMRTHCRDIVGPVAIALDGAPRGNMIPLNKEAFARSPAISFDYAVMERTNRAAVLPAEIGWADVGSWPALWEIESKDGQGNVSKGNVMIDDCRQSHIETDKHLVVGLGLERMVVVHTRDATLVAPFERAEELRGIVETLRLQGRSEAEQHLRVHRPWGWYESLWEAPGYQVKHLMIAPGQAISLQLHYRRSEHWVVQQGHARVTCNNKVFELKPGQSTFIPMTAQHRLENPANEELHVIEVQLGEYLGEDDILRFEDRYARV